MAPKYAPREFQVNIEDKDIEALNDQLDSAVKRVPFNAFNCEAASSHGNYGVCGKTSTDLLEYWRHDYKWKKWESVFNSMGKQYLVDIDGETVHYFHVQDHDDIKKYPPLILIHGWPGSVFEFFKVIPLLRKNFNLIIPSLPGFGWSSSPMEPSDILTLTANLFNCLMVEVLGYQHYIAQGGDLGSIVARDLAMLHPENCVAVHRNMNLDLPNLPNSLKSGFRTITHSLSLLSVAALPNSFTGTTSQDKERVRNIPRFVVREMAYALLHSTKPHTIGWCLDSSPVALCMWILEKFMSWTHVPDLEHLFDVISRDEILTDISIYWYTTTMTSAVRFYHEAFRLTYDEDVLKRGVYRSGCFCNVPMGAIYFPGEVYNSSILSLKFNNNVVHLTDLTISPQSKSRGGHFAALEVPEVLAKDIQKFALESIHFETLCEKRQDESAQEIDTEPPISHILGIAAAPLAVPIAVGTGCALALAFASSQVRRFLQK